MSRKPENQRWLRENYRNPYEQEFIRQAKAAGLEITKRGWPDFIVYHPNSRITFVEVKPPGKQPKYTQKRLALSLKKYNLDILFWSPGDPLP